MEKGVIGFKETPTAPKDTSWDGPGEVAAASVDDLKIMCAWVDSANADNKGAYKLPHHEASGEHRVVWRGVANAMARLPQTQIPDSDKGGVYNHLAKHYAQFDETPPERKEIWPDETKFLSAEIEKAADGLVAVASTNTTDRHGEVVDNNGWDLKAFKKNPILLWGHDHSQPPIGVSSKTWVEGSGKSAKLMIKPVFHDITPQAAAIKELVNQGILKSLSVGFRPLESPDGTTFTKNELLEVSVVNVPANADAMMMAYKSLKSKGFDDDVIEGIGIKALSDSEMAAMQNSMTGMQQGIDKAQGHMNDMMDVMGMSKQALIQENQELKNLVKVQQHQSKKHTEKRLNMQKVIARATDKLLSGQPSSGVDRRMVKTIKLATQKLIEADKRKL